MNSFENGTLVRFVFVDEMFDYYDDGEEWQEFDVMKFFGQDPIIATTIVYLDKKSAKMADSSDEEKVGNWQYINLGTRGMIVDHFEGENRNWYKILANEKTVWTFAENLVVLVKP